MLSSWASSDGAVVRALASYHCGSSSISGPGVTFGLSLLLVLVPGACFSKLPVITGSVKLFCFPFQTGVSKVLKIMYKVKLSAKETKQTSSEVRTHPTFVEILI